MIRKLLAGIIVISMFMHCACRLGLLDRLYQQRNEIAFALGIIKEIPMAMCTSGYDFSTGLNVITPEHAHAVPPLAFHVKEIHLFFSPVVDYRQPQHVLLYSNSVFETEDRYSLTLINPIFHPPSA